MTDYKKKYFKFKSKYLNLKKKSISKNDIVIHRKYNKKAKVIEIHNDNLPTYYTIRFNDGHEIQTIIEKIYKI
jgi:hypothetical protein